MVKNILTTPSEIGVTIPLELTVAIVSSLDAQTPPWLLDSSGTIVADNCIVSGILIVPVSGVTSTPDTSTNSTLFKSIELRYSSIPT